MSDIVDRLRHIADLWEPDEKSSIQREAAAEIERLRAALAAKTEECAAIRALPPPVHDTIKREGGV